MTADTVVPSIDDIDFIVNPDPNGQEWKDIMEWCGRTEGWAFCPTDYATWLSSFPDFWYFMAIDRNTKSAVGGVTLARAESKDKDSKNDLYSVGMYYVRPDYRSTGVGSYLFERLMKQAGDNNICLNAVLRMSPRYAARYGFDKFFGCVHQFYEVPCKELQLPTVSPQYITKDVADVDYSLVQEYDDGMLPTIDRSKYLRKWITEKDAYTKVAFDASGKVVGICCIRVAAPKLCAGPIYADNLDIASTVVHDTLVAIPDWRTYMCLGAITPETCKMAEGLFKQMNGDVSCGKPFCVLQFTKEVIQADHRRCFAMMECAMSFI